jgi:uncharacterized membrane protein YhaH (DUF805 family)
MTTRRLRDNILYALMCVLQFLPWVALLGIVGGIAYRAVFW